MPSVLEKVPITGGTSTTLIADYKGRAIAVDGPRLFIFTAEPDFHGTLASMEKNGGPTNVLLQGGYKDGADHRLTGVGIFGGHVLWGDFVQVGLSSLTRTIRQITPP